MYHTIEGMQNQPAHVRLLRARYRILSRVKVAQGVYFWIAAVLPIISISLGYVKLPGQPVVALFALVTTWFDIAYLDPGNKKRIRLTARLQEEFDCKVLELPWNGFVADRYPRAEEYAAFADSQFSMEREKQLLHWYSTDTRDLSLSQSRFVCQCVNVWYDRKLRDTYARTLKVIAASAIALFVIAGMVAGVLDDVSMDKWVLGLLVPMGPIVVWFTREIRRQSDTVQMLERLASHLETALTKHTEIDDRQDARDEARMFQDAIFNHRATSPLLFDMIYFRQRPQLESGANLYAKDLVDELDRARQRL